MSYLKENTFRDLQIFSVVAETKSYKDAALILKIDISNIGRRIKALEKKLGHQLIIKTNRNLSFTAEGEELYQTFLEQESSFSKMLSRFQIQPDTDGGEIDIAIPSGIIEYILASRIPVYLRNNPNIVISLTCQARKMNVVHEKYDFAILRHIPQQQNLKIRKIYEIKAQLYCTKKYKEKYGIPQTLEQINQHNVISRIHDEMQKGLKYQAHCGNEATSIEISPKLLTNSASTDKIAVMSDEIIAVGEDLLYKEEIEAGNIIPVLPDYHFKHYSHDFESFYLVSDNSKVRRKIVQEFLTYITQIFDELKADKYISC